jgi:hypothetical protein
LPATSTTTDTPAEEADDGTEAEDGVDDDGLPDGTVGIAAGEVCATGTGTACGAECKVTQAVSASPAATSTARTATCADPIVNLARSPAGKARVQAGIDELLAEQLQPPAGCCSHIVIGIGAHVVTLGSPRVRRAPRIDALWKRDSSNGAVHEETLKHEGRAVGPATCYKEAHFPTKERIA